MTNVNSKHLISLPCILRRVFIWCSVLAVVAFIGFKVYSIFTPPAMAVLSPQDGLITKENKIEVKGYSVPEAEIIINNKNIYVDGEGKFSADIDLQKGLNLIKIYATKRYSRANEKEIRVLVDQLNL